MLSPDRVLELMAIGETNRHVASTNMNVRSSRSHTIFRVVIESRCAQPSDSPTPTHADSATAKGALAAAHSSVPSPSMSIRSMSTLSPCAARPVRISTLNLVDLAGSEVHCHSLLMCRSLYVPVQRISKSRATGDRLKESTRINQSLTTLGAVISKLIKGNSTHVPYRLVPSALCT